MVDRFFKVHLWFFNLDSVPDIPGAEPSCCFEGE